jgi:hypothetical protein
MPIKNVGTAEYDFVLPKSQAAGRAVCPFCQGWHSRSTGEPATEACDARYVRIRKVAICVRGRAVNLGAGVRVPTQSEKDAAVAHAFGVVNS